MVGRGIAAIVLLAALFYGIQARAQSCADPLNPCTITTIQQLDDIGVDPSMPLSGDYQLGNNIDASGTATWNGGAGFTPIGSPTNPFTGNLNGNNHSITNLAINSASNYIGLFGDTSGTVQNVNLSGFNIRSSCDVLCQSTPGQLGTLAAINEGTITNTSVNGSITALPNDYTTVVAGGLVATNTGTIAQSNTNISESVSLNGSDVGGLVGQNEGSTNTTPLITSSYSTGSISLTGVGGALGGLVGDNYGGNIKQSYSTASVSGTSNDIDNLGYFGIAAGGLTGSAEPLFGNPCPCLDDISNTYATGSVTVTGSAQSVAGGLVGSNASPISTSYATGRLSVSAGSVAGGLAGQSTGAVTSSYWDPTTTGQSIDGATSGSSPSTTLNSGTLPTGFDPTVWSATAGQYPTLIGVGGPANLLLTPPLPTKSPPASSFPTQIQLLSGQAGSFFNSFLEQSSLEDQNWLIANSTAPVASATLSKNLKLFFGSLTTDLTTVSNVFQEIGLLTFDPNPSDLSGATGDLIAGIGALQKTPQFTSAVSSDVSSGLAITEDGVSDALTCVSAVGTGGVAANLDFDCALNGLQTATDLAALVSQNLAKDPADPNYQSVYIPVRTVTNLAPVGTCTDLDAATEASLDAVNQTLNWEDALLVTSNRYGTALSEGDASSASLQYMTLVNYLGLYEEAAAVANSDLGCFEQLFDASGYGSEVATAQEASELTTYLEGNNASPILDDFFGSFGLTDNDVNSMINELAENPLTLSNDSPDEAIVALTNDNLPVPEPSSIVLLVSALAILLAFSFEERTRTR
jgi:hypothetical protein